MCFWSSSRKRRVVLPLILRKKFAVSESLKVPLPAVLPSVVLLLVAAVQIYLVDTASLTPWKGGGFGMFSTTDSNLHRYVRVLVSAPDRSEELLLRGELRRLAARIQAFPAELLLKNLGREITAEQRSRGLSVETVHIEVWRIDFAKSDLEPRSRNLRKFTYDAGAQ